MLQRWSTAPLNAPHYDRPPRGFSIVVFVGALCRNDDHLPSCPILSTISTVIPHCCFVASLYHNLDWIEPPAPIPPTKLVPSFFSMWICFGLVPQPYLDPTAPHAVLNPRRFVSLWFCCAVLPHSSLSTTTHSALTQSLDVVTSL